MLHSRKAPFATEVQKVEGTRDDVQKLRIETLQKELKDLDAEYDTLESEHIGATSVRDEEYHAFDRMLKMEKRIKEKEDELARAEMPKHTEVLERMLQDATSELAAVRACRNENRQDTDYAIEDLKEQRSELRGRVSRAEAAAASHESTIARLEAELERMAHTRNDVINAHSKTLSELERERNKYPEARSCCMADSSTAGLKRSSADFEEEDCDDEAEQQLLRESFERSPKRLKPNRNLFSGQG